MNKPGMRRLLNASYDEVLKRLPEALGAEGFGVLSEIDVGQTLKQKLGVDFRRYKILGACNPTFAHQVLKLELDVGVLLPCNVIVYETDEGTTVVNAADPLQSIGAFADGDERVLQLARTVREKLTRAIDRLG